MARTSKRARRTSHLYLPSAFDLFKPSKDLVLKNIWIFGPLYAVPFIFWVHSWIWSPLPGKHIQFWQHAGGFSAGWTGSPIPTYPTFLIVGFSLLWLVLIAVLGTIVQIMTQVAQLEAAQGRHLDFHNLWKVVKEIGLRLFGLYVITSLIVIIGLLLFIIPGLIMIRRYFLASYVMIDRR
ncbi:hypothetical protein KW792_01335, partial [Candidatus Saccharibacteria bacterium]|nr:hypothetical protein [Candidatus Saccharibacteria bacterium]